MRILSELDIVGGKLVEPEDELVQPIRGLSCRDFFFFFFFCLNIASVLIFWGWGPFLLLWTYQFFSNAVGGNQKMKTIIQNKIQGTVIELHWLTSQLKHTVEGAANVAP